MTDTTISLHYGVEIDISDITSDTNANIGLYAGVFRWVTNRPDYDGVTIWKEGLISSLGQPNRLINILSGGDYGTLSGFTFDIDNTSVDGSGTGDKFSDVLFDNDYFVISRKVQFYVIINNVFYETWSGIVTSTEYDELKYKFQCQDDFKTIHKPLPPNTITKRIFPNVSSQDEGRNIPVCFGLVEHAELLNVLSMTDALDILKKESAVYRLAPILSYTEGTKTLTILTGEINFSINYFKNYYLKHVLEGDGQVVKITSSSSGYSAPFGIYYAVLILEKILTEEPVLYTLSGTTPGSWVEIYNFDSSYIVSNRNISRYYRTNENNPVLNYWNKDTFDWVDTSETIQFSSVSKISNSIVFPGIKLLSKVVDFDGTYTKYSGFVPKSVIYDGHTKTVGSEITTELVKGTDYLNLRDKDYNTFELFEYWTSEAINATMSIFFLVEFPDNIKKDDFDEIYLLMDSSIELSENASNYDYDINSKVGDSLKLKKFISEKKCDVYVSQSLTADTPLETKLIPEIYYNTGTDNQSLFNSLKSDLTLSSFYDSAIKFRAYPFLRLELKHYIPAIFGPDYYDVIIKLRQLCFIAAKTVNLTSEKVYTRVNGEKIATNTTDNVAMIFQHILDTYDDIHPSNINYNSFVSNRSNWRAGRQITEKKSSKEYLQELCRQTFSCIYPTRDGKRGVKAFRDDTSFSSLVHSTSNGTIIADSISRWELSDINQVYNDFDIKYSFNPASEKFEQSIYIHNADKSYFPHRLATDGTSNAAAADAVTITFTSVSINISNKSRALFLVADTSTLSVGDCVSFVDDTTLEKSFYYGQIVSIDDDVNINVEFDNLENWLITDTTTTGTLYNHYSSIPVWKTYAGGFTNYNTASSRWTVCRNSYLRTGRINPLPQSLSECKWFVEENNFHPNSPGDNSTAHKYLDELIEWTTRQKEIVEYQIPITAANVQTEMLAALTFVDSKYTNGANRHGYITKIKINPEISTISIEATLEPADIDDITGCNIQETGLSEDTIQETGSQDNDYQETGLC